MDALRVLVVEDDLGYVVASILRQSRDGATARLIAVTVHGGALNRRRALAAGFDD